MKKDYREEAEGVNELALTAERDRLGVLLSELHAMVVGECNALLDEDRGGNSRLALAIEDALEAWLDDNTVRKELDKVWDLLSRAWMRGGDGPALLAAARKKWRNEAIEEVLKYRVSTIYRCKPCDIVKVSDIEGLKND